MTAHAQPDTLAVSDIHQLFAAQKAHQFTVANAPIKTRKAKLRALKKAVLDTYRQEIRSALAADMGKAPSEVDLIEIYPVVKEIKHALANLRTWTNKQMVPTPLSFVGSSSYIRYEPKGVCLILSPWNFPVNLCLGPLVSAIAAGNTVIIKPSEFTPKTSRLLKKIITDLFPPEEISVIEGSVETASQLLKLPFNHIFFTGSPKVGKIVMEAAAKNLSSVTLELGGKSPTIVDETANIPMSAKLIAWGKWINSGQVCVAPDFVYVHESRIASFVAEMKKSLIEFFGQDASQSPDYTRMIDQRQLDRVQQYLDDAVHRGATVAHGGKTVASRTCMEPTILQEVSADSMVMQEEIFGPILPILPYTDLDAVLSGLNTQEKPLALYIYSGSRRNMEHISRNTRAGGTCINHNGIHFFHPDLPFGGSNNSGIGKSHGFYGFAAFSNARSYYHQKVRGPLELLMPPYSKLKEKLIEWTVRYF